MFQLNIDYSRYTNIFFNFVICDLLDVMDKCYDKPTWKAASPLLLVATQAIEPVSLKIVLVISKEWLPASFTITLCRSSWMSLCPLRYHWISGGGLPLTRQLILAESPSVTSSCPIAVFKKRGASDWSSSSPFCLIKLVSKWYD